MRTTLSQWQRMLLLLMGLLAYGTLPIIPGPWQAAIVLADDDGEDGDDGGDDDAGSSGGGGDDDHGNDGHGGDENGRGNDDDHDGGYTSDDDHDRAWKARRSGNIASLNDILAKLRKRHGGSVLDVRLKRRRGQPYYVIRLLDRRSRLRTVTVKASGKPARKYNFRSRRVQR